MEATLLVGIWKLKNHRHELADGSIIYPMGTQVVGQLIYTADGYMSAQLMEANRAPFKTDGLYEGTLEEKKIAMETFLSYCGRYRVEGNKVIHSVELSLFPNWTGKEQVRMFKLEKNKLFLRTRQFEVNGVSQTAHLDWERV